MNILDLISEFRISYDLGSLGLPGFEDDEIRQILDKTINSVISQKFSGNNLYKSKFPDTPKRIDDLHNLIGDENLAITGTALGYKKLTLPTDYLHLYELKVVYTGGTIEEATQVSHLSIPRFQQSKSNVNPYIPNPVFLFDKKSTLRLYVDLTNSETDPISTVNCLYITKPTQVMYGLSKVADDEELVDFSDSVFYEIVEAAIYYAINIATPGKSQIAAQQLNKSE